MKIDYLFSVFPFINGERTTLSKLQETDTPDLLEIFNNYSLSYGVKNYMHTAETAFNLKRYVELGFFDKERPNNLLGTIIIGDINPQLESVSLSLLYKKDTELFCAYAVSAITEYLFEYIEVKKVYSKLQSPTQELESIFSSADFKKEGCLRHAVLNAKNEVCDLVVYGKLNL